MDSNQELQLQTASESASSSVLLEYGIETVAALTAILFFTGWQYAHAYFGTFGIGLVSQLEVDVTHYLVWAYPPIMAVKWWLFGAVCLFILVSLFFPKIKVGIRIYGKRILLIVVLISFWSISSIARSVGVEHGQRDIDSGATLLPTVIVTLRDSELAKRISLLPTHSLGESSYLLLGHHRSVYFLVKATYSGGLRPNTPRVILVPSEVIATIEVIYPKETQDE